ncbi:MAG: endolytic transglycosylase MltG [Bacteroidaceae bacterium]|nr:endolytic transglycosylase MltG [Bacteroidaceae bacterium]
MKKYLVALACCLSIALLAVPAIYLTSCYGNDEQADIYIRKGENKEEVRQKLSEAGVRTTGFNLLDKVLDYRVRPGRYVVNKGDNLLTLFRRLRNGHQEPIRLTIPSVRTIDKLAAQLAEKLMIDSVQIEETFHDSIHLFIPNTYEVYWTISPEELLKRMQRENRAFWNSEREAKAKAMGMTHREVMTLASIVDEETANKAEKPMVAGMYVKRLQVGMPLQADPTVKFAIGDFSLRRIWGKHLTVDSPYNTYKNTGLPPGPIRIPSVDGIDAVLNYVHHDYLYMCAKEDFSGTHNFARTYGEHLQNARRYAQALNQRNIK